MILEIAGLLLFVGVALFLMLPMWRAMRRQARQGKWPRVQALVVGHGTQPLRTGIGLQFHVQYEFGGAAYDRWVAVVEGGLTMVGGKRGTGAVARSLEAFWEKHPVGSRIPVMVNPENTKEAYFAEREMPMRLLFFIATTAFTAFFAMFAFIVFS